MKSLLKHHIGIVRKLNFGKAWGLIRFVLGHLEPSLGCLGCVWRLLASVMEVFLGRLGGVSGTSCSRLGSVLGRPEDELFPSWSVLRVFWDDLGTPWGVLETLCARLGGQHSSNMRSKMEPRCLSIHPKINYFLISLGIDSGMDSVGFLIKLAPPCNKRSVPALKTKNQLNISQFICFLRFRGSTQE